MNWLLVSLVLALARGGPVEADLVVRVARLHTGDGRVIAPAIIVIAEGRVLSIGSEAPAVLVAKDRIEVEDGVAVPGFVEGECDAGLPRGSEENEDASEVTPSLRISSVLDRRHDELRALREVGVTSMHVSPGNRNVIGGLSCVIKPRGGTAGATIVRDGVALAAVMASDPAAGNRQFRFGSPELYTRRPTTRMGVVSELRRAFQDGEARNKSADAWKSPFDDEDGAILARAARGDLPVSVVARSENEILTTLNIMREFSVPRFWIASASEAMVVRAQLAARKIPVFIGPLYHGVRGGPNPDLGGRIGEPRLLKEAGVQFALSRCRATAGETLLDAAMAAVRGGLSPDDALAAITSTPAKILGVDNHVGTLAPGKDGDLNVFSGDPLAPTSRLLFTVIDGVVVVNRATADASAKKE